VREIVDSVPSASKRQMHHLHPAERDRDVRDLSIGLVGKEK